MTDTTAPALHRSLDQGRFLRVNSLLWLAIAVGVVIQEEVLRTLSGHPEPLLPNLLWKLSLLPFWAAATPFIVRSARRWPLAGPRRAANLRRHALNASVFIVAINSLVRVPQYFWSSEIDLGGFLASLSRGLVYYGPLALIVYAAIVAIGTRVDGGRHDEEPTVLVSSPPASPPPTHATTLALREGEVLQVIPVTDIDWIEADDNYVRVAAGGRFHRARERLATIEARLDPSRFVRIHRSAIVSLASVRSVKPVSSGDWAVELSNGVRLRVARGRRRLLEEAIAARTGTGPER